MSLPPPPSWGAAAMSPAGQGFNHGQEPSLIYSSCPGAAAVMSQQRSRFKCKTPLSSIKSSVITQTAQERVMRPLRSQ